LQKLQGRYVSRVSQVSMVLLTLVKHVARVPDLNFRGGKFSYFSLPPSFPCPFPFTSSLTPPSFSLPSQSLRLEVGLLNPVRESV